MTLDSGSIQLMFNDVLIDWRIESLDLRNLNDRQYLIAILKNKYCEFNGRNYIVHKNVTQYCHGYGLKFMQEYGCVSQYKEFYKDDYERDLKYWTSLANQGPDNCYYALATNILSQL